MRKAESIFGDGSKGFSVSLLTNHLAKNRSLRGSFFSNKVKRQESNAHHFAESATHNYKKRNGVKDIVCIDPCPGENIFRDSSVNSISSIPAIAWHASLGKEHRFRIQTNHFALSHCSNRTFNVFVDVIVLLPNLPFTPYSYRPFGGC